MHQAEVALLDEIEERQTGGLVLLGDGDDETEVGLHEGAFGVVTLLYVALELSLARGGHGAAGFHLGAGRHTALDGLCETDLIVLREQRVLPDVGEIQTDEIFLVPFNSLLGHASPRLNQLRRRRLGRTGRPRSSLDPRWSLGCPETIPGRRDGSAQEPSAPGRNDTRARPDPARHKGSGARWSGLEHLSRALPIKGDIGAGDGRDAQDRRLGHRRGLLLMLGTARVAQVEEFDRASERGRRVAGEAG